MLDTIVDHFSWGYAVLSLCLGYFLFFQVRDYIWSRQISRLGYRAPKLKKWPMGLDFIYDAVTAGNHNQTLQHWLGMFKSTNTDASGLCTYTFEATLMGRHRVIFTAEPENIKAVLTGQFADFGKGERFHQEWSPFLGDGIFVTDGESWHFARQLARPMFSRDRVVDVQMFERHVQKLIKMLGIGNGAGVEITDCIFKYTLDAATNFLIGAPVGSMDDENNEFAKWFGHIQKVHSKMSRAGPMRALIKKGSYWADLRKMDAFLDPIIQQALDLSPDELNHKLTKNETFIHQMARATRDRKVIRDQMANLLLAGRDTTACTLSWTFYELARNPAVFAKLRKEIIDKLGPDGKMPSYTDIKEMKYLTWTINETLRRYPVVPFMVRTALKDTTLPIGGGPDGTLPIGVREGTNIGYSTILMQRRRDIYPSISASFPYDPDEWAPDRWATWTPKSWRYVPFSGGPRICIGQQFAMMEMGFTICRVLQHFDGLTDLGRKNQDILKCDIVLVPAEGIKIGFLKYGEKTAATWP